MNDFYIMIYANVEKESKRHSLISQSSLFQYVQYKSISVSDTTTHNYVVCNFQPISMNRDMLNLHRLAKHSQISNEML